MFMRQLIQWVRTLGTLQIKGRLSPAQLAPTKYACMKGNATALNQPRHLDK